MKKYDENSIEVLEDLEHVRKRPGMYVGAVDKTGIFQLLKECVDNSIDEYLAGKFAYSIIIEIDTYNNILTVTDDGRGIPLGKHKKTGISTLTTVLTNLQAGGKFGDKDSPYSTSAGLHGVGLKATNALSEWLEARVWKKNKCWMQRFERGESNKVPVRHKENDGYFQGTQIRFKPDPKIFGNHKIDTKQVRKWLQESSHLCPGLKISFILDGESETFVSGGLGQLIKEQAEENEVEFSHDPIIFSTNDNTIQLSLAWSLQDEDTVGTGWWSFVNASCTKDHGTHVTGVKNAIAESLTTYSKTKLDMRDLLDGLYAAVHVLVSSPQFKSQTKDGLLNSEITNKVYDEVYPFLKNYFDSNKQIANQIVDRALALKEAREAYKKKRNAINKITINKKGARGILPDKLAESPFCKVEDRELYIVEGDSAAGSTRRARNADFQEVLPLRGKIPNAARISFDKLMTNKEINAMLTAIGAKINEDGSCDLSKLRVGKCILMCDADVDGQHIESLLLTFFIIWLRDLIKCGKVYIVDSPLFIGTYNFNKYFGHNLEEIVNKSGIETSKMHISRLKGHGEVNAIDLREYAMDPKTRKLWKVIYNETDYELVMQLMGAESQTRKVLLGI